MRWLGEQATARYKWFSHYTDPLTFLYALRCFLQLNFSQIKCNIE
ncbi:hypothetical protein PsWM33_04712 [Pseudovibrio sp. WM33]|nr:hypothetical protein PsWM33_04712 [Pseudovibrio sp. WM33]